MDINTKQIQEVALYGLLTNPFVLSKAIPTIQDNYFTNESMRLIYTSLREYYLKYGNTPTYDELKTVLSVSCEKNNYLSLDNVMSVLDKVLSLRLTEDFINEKLQEFIKSSKSQVTITKILESYKNEGKIDFDNAVSELSENLCLNFMESSAIYNLSDVDGIHQIREDALGDMHNPMLVPFFIEKINGEMQYKALPPGTLNMVSAAPGCGKTTLMINQGMYSAINGFKVLHIFLGDMSKYDGFLRYLSNISGINTNTLVDYSEQELINTVKKYNYTGALGNVTIASYPQGQLNSTQLIEEIVSTQKVLNTHFDVIIVDYDENINKDDEDNIYESGGLIYNRLGMFSVTNRSVVFIVSQPKPQYWNQEIIPLEAAAESSKKQKIIDTMITMGKPSRSSTVGTIFIAKNRRGRVGNKFHIKINGANTQIKHISTAEYQQISQREANANNDENSDEDFDLL